MMQEWLRMQRHLLQRRSEATRKVLQGFRKSLNRHDFALLLVFYAVGATLPWWGIVVPAILLGGLQLSQLQPGRLALIGAFSWFSVALVQDLFTGVRLSARLAAVLGLPSAVLLYIGTSAIAALMVWLGALIGHFIRLGIQRQQSEDQ